MNWDWLIGGAIILALIIGIISKMTGQTIPEMVRGIKEAVEDSSEEGFENIYEVTE